MNTAWLQIWHSAGLRDMPIESGTIPPLREALELVNPLVENIIPTVFALDDWTLKPLLLFFPVLHTCKEFRHEYRK